MALKGILLDAAGTLFESVRPIGESYALFAERHGKKVSAKQLAERFRNCHGSAPPLVFPTLQGKELREKERNWWRELVREVFAPYAPFDRFDAYFAELFDYFAKPEAWVLFNDTNETLRSLRQRGLTLSVISNFDSRLFRILDGLGISRHFDSVWISSQVGYAKPAPEIFHVALRRHGLNPHEVIHVGDSPDTDIAGATGAGLEALLMQSRSSGPPRTGTIRHLAELLPVVDRRH